MREPIFEGLIIGSHIISFLVIHISSYIFKFCLIKITIFLIHNKTVN